MENNQPRIKELGMYETRSSLNDKPVKYFHVSAHNTASINGSCTKVREQP